MRIRIGLALLAALPLQGHAATVRAVFVGIDEYLYSATDKPQHHDSYNPTAGFKDLHGAAGDARRIKVALHKAYGYDLDPGTDSGCASRNAVSITLLDLCATRAAMLAALDDRIAASAPGDTLIFYFAGHGSQVRDDQIFDQPSRYNDTILPSDARNPDATDIDEILDRDIRVIIDRAASLGVNVVTIFDSCNSGSATFGERIDKRKRPRKPDPPPEMRWAEPRIVHHRANRTVASANLALPRVPPGYRAHLAGAASTNSAQEAGPVGQRAGVFTSALVSVLGKKPDQAFDDIFRQASAIVGDATRDHQHPWASGELHRSLAANFAGARPLDTLWVDRRLVVRSGILSGVSLGSAYGIFSSTTDAMRKRVKPLATGIVSSVNAFFAELSLDKKLPTDRFDLKARAIGQDADPGESADRLLALKTVPTPQIDPGFCIATVDYDAMACPYNDGETAIIEAGKAAVMSIVNRALHRNIYVLRIDPDNKVAVVLPIDGSNESLLQPEQALRVDMVMTVPGTYRFVTLSTVYQYQIDARRLAQFGPGNHGQTGCIAEELCENPNQFGEYGRDDTVVPWRATVATVVVK